MFAYGVLFLGIVIAAAALAYMAYDHEQSSVGELRRQLQETSQNNLKIFKKNKELEETLDKMNATLAVMDKKVSDIDREQEASQEHYERLKAGQFDLQDKISRKRPLIQMPQGPIQVEVYTPKKQMGKEKKPGASK